MLIYIIKQNILSYISQSSFNTAGISFFVEKQVMLVVGLYSATVYKEYYIFVHVSLSVPGFYFPSFCQFFENLIVYS